MGKLYSHPSQRSFIYTGSSMNPAFKTGDKLQIIPYNSRKIRRGDVIVFISPGGKEKTTHRVISVDSRRIRTCGDNNTIDPWVLSPENILGRVVSLQRGNGQRRVFGGTIGRVIGCASRTIHIIYSNISYPLSYLLRPAYNWLSRTGLLRQGVFGMIKTRVLSFNRPEGTELQLLMGRWVIGRWLPGTTRWSIRRPFRIFVDEASLPENPSKLSVDQSQSSLVNEKI